MIEVKIKNLNKTPFHDELDAIVEFIEEWTRDNKLKMFEIRVNTVNEETIVFID